MEFTQFQKEILDYLREHPNSTPAEVIDGTKISKGTVTTELRFLTRMGELHRDIKRQPYLYSINTDSKSFEWRRNVVEIKKKLLNGEETKSPILKDLQKLPRGEWPEARRALEQIVQALRELEQDNQLIPTLETPNVVPAKV